MNEKELRDIIQSDFKLWEVAASSQDGNALLKEIDLPYDIGLFSVTFEGVHDAETRRTAVAQFGNEIRNAIDNKISEEAIAARAAQRPSRVGSIYGELSGIDGESTGAGAAIPDAEAVPTFGAHPFASTDDPVARLDALREEHGLCIARATIIKREARALEAYIAVMQEEEDAQEVSGGAECALQEQVQCPEEDQDTAKGSGERDTS